MSDYTLIASKQHVCCILSLGHNDLAFFDSNSAVNYVTFGCEHQKLVGNRDRRPDAAPLQRAAERPFCVYQLLHFCKFIVKRNIDLELALSLESQ